MMPDHLTKKLISFGFTGEKRASEPFRGGSIKTSNCPLKQFIAAANLIITFSRFTDQNEAPKTKQDIILGPVIMVPNC